MNTLKRKLTAILLTFAMLFSLMPALPQAAEAAEDPNGWIEVDYYHGVQGSKTAVNVVVVDESGNQITTPLSLSDYDTINVGKRDTIKLLNDKYYIKSLSTDDGTLTTYPENELNKLTYSWCYMDEESTLKVHIAEKPDSSQFHIDDRIDNNGSMTRTYRIYESQVLKMIASKDDDFVEKFTQYGLGESFRENIEITPNWMQSFGSESEKDFNLVARIDETAGPYWNLDVTSDSADVDEVQPDRILYFKS